VRLFALKHVNGKQSHYVPAPPQEVKLAAVTLREAIGDLAPIVRKSWAAKDGKPARKMEELTGYVGSASAYGLLMRKWGNCETQDKVSGHIVRHTPRDYVHFAAMRHGEQYPAMHRRANRRFALALARRRKAGEALRRNSPAWCELRDAIVPPYDPEKFPNKWRKLEPDKPSCTLTAHLGKDSYSHIHYDSDQARTISVREAARLQSFPDGFIFSGAMNAAFRQVGNAVPPLLAFAIAKKVRCVLAQAQRDVEYPYRVAAE
jgi:DNA (cytosine-5)-methyltransferase 1